MNKIIVNEISSYSDHQENTIYFSGTPISENINIVFHGSNNKIYINDLARISKLAIEFHGSNATVKIGKNGKLMVRILIGSNSEVSIGDGLSTTGQAYITAFEGANVVIGDDCMFAAGVSIRSDDAHPIFSVRTGDRINKAKSIKIGSHVWIGEGSVLLSGTEIGDGSVIGTRSVVKGKIPNNCIAAGVSAKIIKRNIAWERPHFSREKDFDKEGKLLKKTDDFWNYTIE